ncbi:hypothetical protein ACXIVK_27950 [Paraburkholderia caledonica]|jgi:hypothetical protein
MTCTTQTDKKLEAAWETFKVLYAKTPLIRLSTVAEFLAQNLAGSRRPTHEQRDIAQIAAKRFMAAARKSEQLIKVSNVHWRFAQIQNKSRKLLDGRVVAEHQDLRKLTVETRCPRKWLSVDLESGEIWEGNEVGEWARVSPEAIAALKLAVEKH